MQEAGYLRQSHFRFVFLRHLPKSAQSLSKLNGRTKVVIFPQLYQTQSSSSVGYGRKKKERIDR